jgi:HAD superfamily hydrolase (TIGR01490 family)
MMKTTQFAVFDVDNTVLGFKSLFEFARFYCEQSAVKSFEVFEIEVKNRAKLYGREEANRHFYTLFADVPLKQLSELVELWSRQFWVAGWPLVGSTLTKLREHQQQGDNVIWLSGSATLFLEPLAAALGVDAVIASELEVIGGACTGRTIGMPVIGEGKLARLKSHLKEQSLFVEDGTGYGDHYSDKAFMEMLGRAYVVAGDPELEKIAKQQGWEILPSNFKNHLIDNIRKAS